MLLNHLNFKILLNRKLPNGKLPNGKLPNGNCQMGIAKWELPNGNIAKWDTFLLDGLSLESKEKSKHEIK